MYALSKYDSLVCMYVCMYVCDVIVLITVNIFFEKLIFLFTFSLYVLQNSSGKV